jgi:hypothetical protein
MKVTVAKKSVETAKDHGVVFEITRTAADGEVKWELSSERFRVHPDEDPDYVLGRDQHLLTAERWELARREFQNWARERGFVVADG